MKIELVKRIIYDLVVDKSIIATFDTISRWNECLELMEDEEYGKIILIPVPKEKDDFFSFPIIKIGDKKYFLYKAEAELIELLKDIKKEDVMKVGI